MNFFLNYYTDLFGKWRAGAMACMWKSEDDLQSQFALSTLWVLETQIITIGGKSLYPLCHLTGPKLGTLACTSPNPFVL